MFSLKINSNKSSKYNRAVRGGNLVRSYGERGKDSSLVLVEGKMAHRKHGVPPKVVLYRFALCVNWLS